MLVPRNIPCQDLVGLKPPKGYDQAVRTEVPCSGCWMSKISIRKQQHCDFDPGWVPAFRKIPQPNWHYSVCPCINWVLFCGSLFSFFFFQALYIKAVSPCLFFRTSESRVSNFESIEGKQPALRVCVTLEQDTRRESRTVPEQQKLQTKPGGYGKSVTVKNTTQPMPPPYELIALGRGSTMGFGRLDSFWSELHQSTAINTGNNPVSKLPGLYLSVFPGPEQ